MKEQSVLVNFNETNTGDPGVNEGQVLVEAVQKLQGRLDQTPLLLHGNFAPWANNRLTLADIVICATAAGVHLAFISQTGTAKSMAANVILKALCRDMEKLDCVGDLDSSILKEIRPHENGIIINDSRLTKVEGVQMEELNRTIPFAQPVLKLIIGNSYSNHKMIISTMNPPGSRYHVENLDVSIASGFVQVNFEYSMSNEDRKCLKNQKILGFNRINTSRLRGDDGRPLIQSLLAIRRILEDIVPMAENAEILLDCINMNKCWRSYSSQKAEMIQKECMECSCHKTSACGLVASVPPTTILKLCALARAYALLQWSQGKVEKREVTIDHLLMWLPMIITALTCDMMKTGTEPPESIVLTWANGLLQSIARFRHAFADILDTSPEELEEPVKKAMNAFRMADNPSVVDAFITYGPGKKEHMQ